MHKIFLLFFLAAATQLYGTYPQDMRLRGSQMALSPPHAAGPSEATAAELPNMPPYADYCLGHPDYERVKEAKRQYYLVVERSFSGGAITERIRSPTPHIQESDVQALATQLRLAYRDVALILATQQILNHRKLWGHLPPKTPQTYTRAGRKDPVYNKAPDFRQRLNLLPGTKEEYEAAERQQALKRQNPQLKFPKSMNNAIGNMWGAIECAFLGGHISYAQMLCLEIDNKFGNAAKHECDRLGHLRNSTAPRAQLSVVGS